MEKWQHVFYGDYAGREKILSELSLDQVNKIPSGMPHSIFAELWHTVLWQNIMVDRNEELYEQQWKKGERYPAKPAHETQEWSALVDEFHAGLIRALEWTTSPQKLSIEVDLNTTMADILYSLAVHNAYHMGKIVALRQMMGAWPH